MIKKLKIISLILFISVGLSSCKRISNNVAYTVYPVGYIFQKLAKNSINATSIQNDEIIQRATLKDNYKEILENSSTFFYIGNLEPYLSTHRNEIRSLVKNRIDLSNLNAIYKFQRYTPVYTDEEITYIENPYYKDDSFNNIDIPDRELCLWLDPISMLSMGKDIKNFLVKNYSQYEFDYNENYKRLEDELVNLDVQYQNLSTKLHNENKEIKFVSMTPSFGSWQKAYGIQVYPIILSKYGALPNSYQLEIIKNKIKNDGVQYIAYEPNMSEDMLELFKNIKEELNLKQVTLYNLSSLTESQKNEGKDYITVMYENLAVLETMSTERENK